MVTGDELRDGRGRLRGLVAVVLDEQLDLLAEHTSGAIDLFESHPDPISPREGERRLRARQGPEKADLDPLRFRGLLPAARQVGQDGSGEQDSGESAAHGGIVAASANLFAAPCPS